MFVEMIPCYASVLESQIIQSGVWKRNLSRFPDRAGDHQTAIIMKAVPKMFFDFRLKFLKNISEVCLAVQADELCMLNGKMG